MLIPLCSLWHVQVWGNRREHISYKVRCVFWRDLRGCDGAGGWRPSSAAWNTPARRRRSFFIQRELTLLINVGNHEGSGEVLQPIKINDSSSLPAEFEACSEQNKMMMSRPLDVFVLCNLNHFILIKRSKQPVGAAHPHSGMLGCVPLLMFPSLPYNLLH